MRRLLAEPDGKTLIRIVKVRRRVRRHVWMLLHRRPGGFPWLTVAERRLRGWIVVGLDATVITSASRKQGAAATFKGTLSFHPLGSRLANPGESLAMELRADRRTRRRSRRLPEQAWETSLTQDGDVQAAYQAGS